ncbi:LuxR C-terminal-related transcriptional regulator [Phaeobacter sp. 11ANDIMAR09]|uniref:LuxR C-terminal-related transcriptional regulator n=1 Tax=Phaeobacter sp. 11ANDIMAR09 TaxID=1225647 RepID=UPI000B171E79|nr:LuxR C-terminal-related transcriptional regulator [Phaeobacter sp. 11ANDIMAR09]
MTTFLQENFSGFGYVVLGLGEMPTSAVTNFEVDWHQKYFAEQYHRVDPVFKFFADCRGRSGTRLVSEAEMETPLYEEAKLYGADSNFISVSAIGGSQMVLGGVNHDLDVTRASMIHKSCRAAHRSILLERVDQLSDLQIDFLEMCEEGLIDKQIACELGVSISAVAQRKKAICNKIGVSNFRAALSLYSVRKWSGIVPLV